MHSITSQIVFLISAAPFYFAGKAACADDTLILKQVNKNAIIANKTLEMPVNIG